MTKKEPRRSVRADSKNSSSSSRSEAAIAESFRLEELLQPNADGIVRISAAELDKLPPGKTDWAKFDALTEEDIARAVAEDPDAAPLDVDWSNAVVMYPKGKMPVSIRIDPEVLAFFKAQGPRYQTRINAVLRDHMERQRSKAKRRRRKS